MRNALRLSPVAHLAQLVGDGELVAFNVGLDGLVYVVIAMQPLDYRTDENNASFAKTVPDQPQDYRVISLRESDVSLDVIIHSEHFNIHDVQPLRMELLLVCARSYYRGRDDYEKNGRVYSREGKFLREILLGDGIKSVQTTSDGVIWTSFFDEGVFGNYGWINPVGASGLVAWNGAGNKLYEFQPPERGLDICDCYALNVATEMDVWCYYYTEFPLVHLQGRQIKSVWKMPLGGSDAFAIAGRHALFRGGYNDRDTYHVFSLGSDGKVSLVGKVELSDRDGARLKASWVVGRGDTLHIISNGFLYAVDVRTVIGSK